MNSTIAYLATVSFNEEPLERYAPFVRAITDVYNFKCDDMRSAISKGIKPTQIDCIQLNILKSLINSASDSSYDRSNGIYLPKPDSSKTSAIPGGGRFLSLWKEAFRPLEGKINLLAAKTDVKLDAFTCEFPVGIMDCYCQSPENFEKGKAHGNVGTAKLSDEKAPKSSLEEELKFKAFEGDVRDLFKFKRDDVCSAILKGIKPTQIDFIQLNILKSLIQASSDTYFDRKEGVFMPIPDPVKTGAIPGGGRFLSAWNLAFAPLKDKLEGLAESHEIKLNPEKCEFPPVIWQSYSELPEGLGKSSEGAVSLNSNSSDKRMDHTQVHDHSPAMIGV